MTRPSAVQAPAWVGAGGGHDTSLMAKALAGLFCAGATLALLTVALPRSQDFDEIGMLAVVGNAYVIAALLYRLADRLSPRMLRPALAWGSTLITAVAYFSAESPSPLVFFYLWVFLYASYFFTRPETIAQVVYVGAVYAALLAMAPPASGTAAWWVVGMGALVVAAVLIGAMRRRTDVLIEQLYDSARTDPLTGLLNRRGFRELLDRSSSAPGAARAASRWWSGTSTTSRRSTTAGATTSAMPRSSARPASWTRTSVSSTWSPASAARSSR
jgi:hypothetical protein